MNTSVIIIFFCLSCGLTRFRVLDYIITRFRIMSIVFLKLFNIFSSYPQNVRIFNKNRTRTPTGSKVFLLLYGAKRTRKRNIIILLHYIEETHHSTHPRTRNGYRMTPSPAALSSDRRPNPEPLPALSYRTNSHQRTPGTDDRRAKQEPPGLEVRPERLEKFLKISLKKGNKNPDTAGRRKWLAVGIVDSRLIVESR